MNMCIDLDEFNSLLWSLNDYPTTIFRGRGKPIVPSSLSPCIWLIEFMPNQMRLEGRDQKKITCNGQW